MKIQRPKGTRDILPSEIPRWAPIEESTRRVFHRYGYREIRTPMFESTELFARGIGEATDIVQKEMYTFTDRGQRSLTLRPEGTAGVVRAFLENGLVSEPRPWKVWYMGPMFRYERPQAGRFRQHNQIGAEQFGTPHPEGDFEIIDLFVALLEVFGLRSPTVKLGSVGDAKCRPAYTEVLRTFLRTRAASLCEDCIRRTETNPLRVLDCKVPGCREVVREAPVLLDSLCDECRAHHDAVRALLATAGIRHEVDAHLVRGLDYYTRTVFEVHHENLGAQSALGGGGRYDRLVAECGGPDVPAVGFSSGMERIVEALTAERPETASTREAPDAVFLAATETARNEVLALASRLRRQIPADQEVEIGVDLSRRTLSAQMKWADRIGARNAVVIGDEEIGKGIARVKDMRSGKESEVPLNDLAGWLLEGRKGERA